MRYLISDSSSDLMRVDLTGVDHAFLWLISQELRVENWRIDLGMTL